VFLSLVKAERGARRSGRAGSVTARPVVVIDYGAGNLESVMNALRHLGVNHFLTSRPAELDRASAMIFPVSARQQLPWRPSAGQGSTRRYGTSTRQAGRCSESASAVR